MDFWLVLSKNDSNIICSSIKNESFLKIWRVWHILKVCHALWYLKIEMGIAGSIFELHPPNFQKMCIFWRFTNDISTIFCYLLWFQFWKKCQSLPVHPRVVPDASWGEIFRNLISVLPWINILGGNFHKIFCLFTLGYITIFLFSDIFILYFTFYLWIYEKIVAILSLLRTSWDEKCWKIIRMSWTSIRNTRVRKAIFIK